MASVPPKKRPSVALESTIYAFGLPYPKNVELGWKIARTITSTGAEPKTFAVIDGGVRVGLTDAELDRIARAGIDGGVVKLNASDLGPAIALGLTGATTVSATCTLAAASQVRVFATGGIGGVHRGAAESFDESQDLIALSRTPVCVISAGAKAILDLEKTLERLETLGVPVIGYRTSEMPGFYTRTTGIPLPLRVDDVATLALVLRAHWRVHPNVGVLVVNPIPEAYALPQGVVDEAIETALRKARDEGIRGKALTPFLLQTLEALTDGRSVEANVALVEDNAQLGGKLAVALDDEPERAGAR